MIQTQRAGFADYRREQWVVAQCVVVAQVFVATRHPKDALPRQVIDFMLKGGEHGGAAIAANVKPAVALEAVAPPGEGACHGIHPQLIQAGRTKTAREAGRNEEERRAQPPMGRSVLETWPWAVMMR